MKNFILIIAFLLLSCNNNLKKEVNFNEVSIEWSGNIDKPIYKIVICTNCSFYQSLELCRLKVSNKIMKNIMKLEIENHQLIIDELNKEEGIQKLDQIYQLLKRDEASEVSLEVFQTFKKRIS